MFGFPLFTACSTTRPDIPVFVATLSSEDITFSYSLFLCILGVTDLPLLTPASSYAVYLNRVGLLDGCWGVSSFAWIVAVCPSLQATTSTRYPIPSRRPTGWVSGHTKDPLVDSLLSTYFLRLIRRRCPDAGARQRAFFSPNWL